METFKIFILYYGTNIFLTLIISISVLFIIWDYKKQGDIKDEYKIFLIFYTLVLGLTILGFILGIGFNYYGRVYRLSYFTVIILSGYSLMKIAGRNIRYIHGLVFGIVVLVTVMQFYSHPALIPRASIIFDVEQDVPLVYRGQVNSIYQRMMVEHAFEYAYGKIACDAVTRNQVIGLTDPNYFNAYVTWYYPPDKQDNPRLLEKEYEIYLLHLPGISGAFEERANVRDKATILGQIYSPEYDMLFSNSQSFILYKR